MQSLVTRRPARRSIEAEVVVRGSGVSGADAELEAAFTQLLHHYGPDDLLLDMSDYFRSTSFTKASSAR
jgi:hypothetical protein